MGLHLIQQSIIFKMCLVTNHLKVSQYLWTVNIFDLLSL